MAIFRADPRDSFKKRLFISYGADWVLVLLMAIVFFAIDIIPPFHREFSITDTSLMHEYTVNESVPVWLLMVVAIVIPIVVIIFYAGFYRRNWLDFNSGLLGLGLALTLTIMMTDVIKITVGRPRPDMLDRCQPPAGIENPPLLLLNYTICTADHNSYIFKDGFKSFPSGHASFSFAGLGYLSFFLAGKMHLFDRGGHTYKSFVFSFPFLGALLIAISRLHDYRHHWQDVFIGGIIGTVFAYFCYRQYYPSLGSIHSQKPYPPRIKRPQDIFPEDGHQPTDEEQAVVPGDSEYGDYAERPTHSEHSNSSQHSINRDHHHHHPEQTTPTTVHSSPKFTVDHIENQSTSNSTSATPMRH